MTLMKVLFVTEPNQAPSTRLRVGEYIDDYREHGVAPTLLSPKATVRERRRVIREAGKHDVVVLCKTTSFTILQLRSLRRANPKIIFDYDDAVMFREQKFRQPLTGKSFKKFLRTLHICKAAVAGNSYLGSFAEACDVPATVLATPIDLRKYKLKTYSPNVAVTVGWLGLSDGLPYLEFIEPALQRLAERFPGFRLRVICDKPLTLKGVRVENELWQRETEQGTLASFDVGIMPLWDSVWTRGKCGYKILQYMGVGTPVVASDVGVNSQIITHGENGFIARTQDDWVERISELLSNVDVRRRLGGNGRKLVERCYSHTDFIKSYVNLLNDVAAARTA